MKLVIVALLVNGVTSQSLFSNCKGIPAWLMPKNFAPGVSANIMCKCASPCVTCKCASARGQNVKVFSSGQNREHMPASQLRYFSGSHSGPTPEDGLPFSVGRRTVGALLGAGAIGLPLGHSWDAKADSATGSDIKLVDDAGGLKYTWDVKLDATMAGVGKAEATATDKNGALVFSGFCDFEPLLYQKVQNSGYVVIETRDGQKAFPDVSSCEGISITAKNIAKDPRMGAFPGFNFCFGGGKGSRGKGARNSRCYKAPITPPEGEFGTVKIPFKSFSNFWDSETGAIIKNCQDSPKSCPDESALKNPRSLQFWAEAKKSQFELQVKEISAYGCAPKATSLIAFDGASGTSPSWYDAFDGASGTNLSWFLPAISLVVLISVVVRRQARSVSIAPTLLG